MSELKTVGADGETGKVVVILADENGSHHTISLSVFDVSMFLSMLKTARDEALKVTPPKEPIAALRITGLMFGKSDGNEVMRISVGTGFHHDFFAPPDDVLAILLREMSRAAATASAAHQMVCGDQPPGKIN